QPLAHGCLLNTASPWLILPRSESPGKTRPTVAVWESPDSFRPENALGEAPPGSVQRMALEPLSLSAVEILARNSGRAAREIYRLTGGNPFLVTEILAVEGDATPESVRDATLSRAARLPTEAQSLLETASVFPRRAKLDVLEKLCPGALAGLDACVERGMLQSDHEAVRFRHELARRAIEDCLPPGKRRSLHQHIVELLEADPSARASEIAHHSELAGNIPAVVKYAQRAGEEAAREGAPREAASHFAAVLRHRRYLGPEQTLAILELHAEQSYLMGAAELAVELMTEAAELRRASGDAIGLGRDLTRLTRYSWICGSRANAERFVTEAIAVLETLGPSPELASAYSHQSQLDMLAADEDSAILWGERALKLAEPLGAQEIIVHALGNVGTARIQRDDLESSPELEKSLELARKTGMHDHFERASCNLTCAAYWRRDHDGALEHIDRGVAYASKRDLVHWEAYLLGWRALANLDRGDYPTAEMGAQSVCGWRGVPDLYRTPALYALARVRVRRGDPDADIPLEEARRLTEHLHELQRDAYTATIDAERVWLARGWNAETQDRKLRGRDALVIDRLLKVHERAIERKLRWAIEDTALWLFLLDERFHADDLSEPFSHHVAGRWREAAAGWAELGYPYEQAIALSTGDEDAQREAVALFDRLGAAPAAARLRRKMRSSGVKSIPRGPNSGTRANPLGLTRRQVQVLELVADGLSNPEIADRLCISAKTAEHHVSALITRLEVTSRKEAAAAARQLGLIDAS
ncbi:MAG: helix-turn-helix transcriptional regulator, partial [Alphaproteobacteria bacterium]|nr:helix-turn-helix transcriptional regulator [Alphaproteobacteria bacterium]